MNVSEWLQRSALRYPEAPALYSGHVLRATYAEFADSAARLASALVTQLGVKSGDRVALFMPNRTDYLELLYAACHAGAIVVPINHKLHPQEVAWIVTILSLAIEVDNLLKQSKLVRFTKAGEQR